MILLSTHGCLKVPGVATLAVWLSCAGLMVCLTTIPAFHVIASAILQSIGTSIHEILCLLFLQETTLLMQPPIILFAPSMIRRVIPHAIKMQFAEGDMATRAIILFLLGGLLAMAATFIKSLVTPLIS